MCFAVFGLDMGYTGIHTGQHLLEPGSKLLHGFVLAGARTGDEKLDLLPQADQSAVEQQDRLVGLQLALVAALRGDKRAIGTAGIFQPI